MPSVEQCLVKTANKQVPYIYTFLTQDIITLVTLPRPKHLHNGSLTHRADLSILNHSFSSQAAVERAHSRQPQLGGENRLVLIRLHTPCQSMYEALDPSQENKADTARVGGLATSCKKAVRVSSSATVGGLPDT